MHIRYIIILKGPAIKHTAHSTRFATLSTEIWSMLFKSTVQLEVLDVHIQASCPRILWKARTFPKPFSFYSLPRTSIPPSLVPRRFFGKEEGLEDRLGSKCTELNIWNL